MLNIVNRYKIKQAIENNKNYAPREWRNLCINKIRSGYGGTYPQFNTIEQLELALIKTKWHKQKEVLLPPNVELYVSDLQGQMEYVHLDSLNFDTLLYANVDEETNDLTLTVKGVNPGRSLNSYLLLEKRGDKNFVKTFSTGDFTTPSKTTKHNYKSGDIITKKEAASLHLEMVTVNKISLSFCNKVTEAIRQSKNYYPEVWKNGCENLIENCYKQFKSVEEFESALQKLHWSVMKRSSRNGTLRYISKDLSGIAETCKIENIKDTTELIFKRENPEDEESDGYIVAIGESVKVSRVIIADVTPENNKLIISSIYCGMPVTLLNKGTARYRNNERISKTDAMNMGFQYVLV